eukprot:3445853-Amphidinium_carterae.1
MHTPGAMGWWRDGCCCPECPAWLWNHYALTANERGRLGKRKTPTDPHRPPAPQNPGNCRKMQSVIAFVDLDNIVRQFVLVLFVLRPESPA